MNHFYLWLGKWKDSPVLWQASVAVLVVLATHYARHWTLVAAAMLLSIAVPATQDPDAQRIHYCLGLLAVVWAGYWGLLFLGFAYWMERYFDPKYEPDPWKWGGIVDFAAYCAGAASELVSRLV